MDKTKIPMLLCLAAPALITFLLLLLFRDAFLLLGVLIVALYFGPTLFNKLAQKNFDYKTELALEIPTLL